MTDKPETEEIHKADRQGCISLLIVLGTVAVLMAVVLAFCTWVVWITWTTLDADLNDPWNQTETTGL